MATLPLDWPTRGVTSVSRRKPESSHFTHRLRGIYEKYGTGEKKKKGIRRAGNGGEGERDVEEIS